MKLRQVLCGVAGLCWLWVAGRPAGAEAAMDAYVPDELKPWKGWVLEKNPEINCPHSYNALENKQCAWATQLRLTVNKNSAVFSQTWSVYTETWARLPGNAEQWPQDVRVDGQAAPVGQNEGRPILLLSRGEHVVTGTITWDERPQYIQTPEQTALFSLTLDGNPVSQINVDVNGKLWLGGESAVKQEQTIQNEAKVRVYRKLIDEIPLRMVTQVHLNISGQDRELLLGQLLLDSAVALGLESELPARIEKDGRLRVQVVSGSWTVRLTSRHLGPAKKLIIQRLDPQWPAEEIWVFEARQALRTVELKGADAIDPQQTDLPDDWKQLPAYLLREGTVLELTEKTRGDFAPTPDRLTLDREIWVDFDGKGLTFKDRINGTIDRGSRLSMQPGYELGRVELNGQPQLITTIAPAQPPGVEVRQGAINLQAVSRYIKSRWRLPAVGWDHDFSRVNVSLNLPPGWSLLHAGGVDRARSSWVEQWSIWDLFLVFIIAVIWGKLMGVRWGVAAALTLLLTYHVPKAPVYAWLNIIVVLVVLNYIPASRFKKILTYYRNLSFLVLIGWGITFSVDQVRKGIYPQLAGTHDGALISDYVSEVTFNERTAPPPPPKKTPPRVKMTEPPRVEPKFKAGGPKEGFGGGGGGSLDDLIGGLGGADAMNAIELQKKGSIKITTGPQIVEGSTSDRDIDDIRAVVMDRLGGLKYAYNTMLKKYPNLRGRITTKFTIAASGEVTKMMVMETNMNCPELEAKITRIISKWQFRKSDAGDVAVICPFVFTPQDNYGEKMSGIAAPAKIQTGPDDYGEEISDIDATAKIQTGPGEPNWNWKKADLEWSGPVNQEQKLKLVLIGPLLNRLLCFIEVALVVWLLIGMLLFVFGKKVNWGAVKGFWFKIGALGAAVCIAALLVMSPTPARADYPSPELLKDLEERLTSPPACGNNCASLVKGRVNLSGNQLSVRLVLDALDNVSVPLPAGTSTWLPRTVLVDGVPAKAMNNQDGELLLALATGRHDVLMEGPVAGNSVQLLFGLEAHNLTVETNGWIYAGLVKGRVPGGSLQFNKEAKTQSAQKKGAALLPDPISPFLEIERLVRLRNEWEVITTATRIAPAYGAINAEVPLLENEAVLSANMVVTDRKIKIAMQAGQGRFTWRSALKTSDTIHLKATEQSAWTEVWVLDAATRWHTETRGIARLKAADDGGNSLPQWRPWPGEELAVMVTKPSAIAGATQTIEEASVLYEPGKRAGEVDLRLRIRSGQGDQAQVTLMKNIELQTVTVDGEKQAVSLQDNRLIVPLHPGMQEVRVAWKEKKGVSFLSRTPRVDLHAPATNINLQLELPQDRWAFFLGGPSLGPAMLFWGMFFVIILIAGVLGKIPGPPVRTYEWLLLFVGMSTINKFGGLLVIVWFFALARRRQYIERLDVYFFNLAQAGLVVLTLAALASLIYTIPMGLLGQPDMQVVGHASDNYTFKWYQDHCGNVLPQGWVISFPLWVYRLVMLAWSLWLAFSLVKWLKWGWGCFNELALWKKKIGPEEKTTGND
jgi:hypothetical protein